MVQQELHASPSKPSPGVVLARLSLIEAVFLKEDDDNELAGIIDWKDQTK